MLRQFSHEHSLMTVVSQAHCYVSLTATGDDTEMVCLNETVISIRRKAEHNLAKSYYFSHCFNNVML